MKDIQSQQDSRRIGIRKVGVKTITYPIRLLDKARNTQHTVARVNMYVNLPHRFKGTHMSRFIEILNRFHGDFKLKTFQHILEEMKVRLNAETAHLEMAFPYFLQRDQRSMPGWVQYECRLRGSLASKLELLVEVDVPVPLFYSPAHPPESPVPAGFWGMVTASVQMNRFLWLEDLIDLIEQGAISLEAGVPGSVEPLCRRISDTLGGHGSFTWYKVVVKKMSSGYSTYASTEWP